MTIFSRHPYSFLFAGAGIVLLTIVLSMKYENAVPADPNAIVYVSGGPMPSASSYSASTTVPAASAPTAPETLTFATPAPVQQPVPAISTATPATPPPKNTTGTDLGARASVQANPSTDPLLQEVYSLIPTGTFQTRVTSRLQSPEQQALHTYGNEAGLAVLTFENSAPGMLDVLKAWLADRTDAAAVANAQKLVASFTQAGRDLEGIPDVPNAANAANDALAKSYGDAGQKLQALLVSGGNDGAVLNAMRAYNASVDTFTNSYINLVNIFSLNNVTFGASEPGSAFQFPGSGGL